ncbi:MAG: hypothetical protein NTY60_07880 [Proteobacteria bacterium]|nr:hypothetical protein [Pseudomonadota bacterium]
MIALVLSMDSSFGADLSAAKLPPVILFIGDSHAMGSFGMQEDAVLRSLKGFNVATYAVCGSSPHNWFEGGKTRCGYYFRDTQGHEQRGWEQETPLIIRLLAVHQPRYTVVELGANMYGKPVEWVEQTSHEMAMAIVNSGSKCIWIGPPHARIQSEPELSRVFDALRAGVGPYCLLFDSRTVAAYPASGGDGIHFNTLGEPGARIAENWALSAFYAFNPLFKLSTSEK